jgi:hypothetical protein
LENEARSAPPLTPENQDPGEPARESQFYQELRQKQDEIRREQEEYADQSATREPAIAGGISPPSPPATSAEAPSAESKPARSSSSGASLRIDGKMISEMRGALIIAGVMIGLLALLGFIVFIATTIAASNTPRGQRRYY